jgi:hypothetical protein
LNTILSVSLDPNADVNWANAANAALRRAETGWWFTLVGGRLRDRCGARRGARGNYHEQAERRRAGAFTRR